MEQEFKADLSDENELSRILNHDEIKKTREIISKAIKKNARRQCDYPGCYHPIGSSNHIMI